MGLQTFVQHRRPARPFSSSPKEWIKGIEYEDEAEVTPFACQVPCCRDVSNGLVCSGKLAWEKGEPFRCQIQELTRLSPVFRSLYDPLRTIAARRWTSFTTASTGASAQALLGPFALHGQQAGWIIDTDIQLRGVGILIEILGSHRTLKSNQWLSGSGMAG